MEYYNLTASLYSLPRKHDFPSHLRKQPEDGEKLQRKAVGQNL